MEGSIVLVVALASLGLSIYTFYKLWIHCDRFRTY